MFVRCQRGRIERVVIRGSLESVPSEHEMHVVTTPGTLVKVKV